MPESHAEGLRPPFDAAGAASLTGGLLLLIFTLGEATRVGWGTARTLVSLAGVVALLATFVIVESRVKAPMMPFRIFRLRTMRTANIEALLVFAPFTAMFFFVSIFMQQIYGYSPITAGMAYVPLAVCVAIGAWAAGALMARTTARTILIAGLVITVAGLLLLWRAPIGGGYALDLLPAFLAVGLGCGMCLVTLQIAAFVGVGGEEAGVGAGLINTSQAAGGALGLAVVATIAYRDIGPALAAAGHDVALIRTAQAASNHDAFLASACIAFLGLVVAVLLMPRAAR